MLIRSSIVNVIHSIRVFSRYLKVASFGAGRVLILYKFQKSEFTQSVFQLKNVAVNGIRFLFPLNLIRLSF